MFITFIHMVLIILNEISCKLLLCTQIMFSRAKVICAVIVLASVSILLYNHITIYAPNFQLLDFQVFSNYVTVNSVAVNILAHVLLCIKRSRFIPSHGAADHGGMVISSYTR